MSTQTLDDFEATSVQMELKSPKTGEGLGVFLELLGPDSVEFRNCRNQFIKKRAAQTAEVTTDELEMISSHLDELLTACVVGWSSDAFFKCAFSKTAVLDIMRNVKYAWIRDQVNEFTDKRANFFR